MNARPHPLALTAVAAFALYILACQPAFSPDGRQLLFTSSSSAEDRGGSQVWLLDLKSHKSRPLAQFNRDAGDDANLPPLLHWTPDGRAAVIARQADDHVLVSVLPVRSPGVTRLFVVNTGDRDDHLALEPFPVLGNGLYLGGPTIHRLDLQSGQVTRMDLPPRPAGDTNTPELHFRPLSGGNHLYYLGAVSQQNAELGELDPDSLHRTPRVRIQLDAQDELTFVACAPAGKRFAFTTGKGDRQTLHLYQDWREQRPLPFGATNQQPTLGNLVWSPDARTLYAAAFRPSPSGSDTTAFSLLKIDPETGIHQETPLFAIPGDDDENALLWQIGLSPDGRTVAAFSLPISPEKGDPPTAPAVYLVDLRRSPARVTRVPIPIAPSIH